MWGFWILSFRSNLRFYALSGWVTQYRKVTDHVTDWRIASCRRAQSSYFSRYTFYANSIIDTYD